MTDKLVKLSIYNHVACDLCGTNWDCSPQGMYRHEKFNHDSNSIQTRNVCATCVLYTHPGLFLEVSDRS